VTVTATRTASATATRTPNPCATQTATATPPPGGDIDLEPDLSQAFGKINGVHQIPVELDRSYRPIEIYNVIIKNNGSEAAPASTQFTVYVANKDYSVQRLIYTGPVGQVIPAKDYVYVSPITLSSTAIRQLDELKAFARISYRDLSNFGSIDVLVDSNRQIQESNEDNNEAARARFFHWSALAVTVVEAYAPGTEVPVAGATVTIKSADHQAQEKTTADGRIDFALLRQPAADVVYTITVSYRGQDDLATAQVTIDKYDYYQLKLKIQPRVETILRPNPLVPKEFAPTNFVPFPTGGVAEGTAEIETDTGQRFRQALLEDGTFNFVDIPAGVRQVYLVEMVAVIRFDFEEVITDGTVRYHWQRDRHNQLVIVPGSVKAVDLKLTTDCDAGTTTIEFCIYDEPEKIREAKATYLKTFSNTLNRLSSFDPSVRPTITRRVWVVPYFDGAGAFFEDVPDLLWIMGRYVALHPLIAETVITHESMHAIDYQLGGGRPSWFSQRFPYAESFELTASGSPNGLLSQEVGVWAWQRVGHTCALMTGEAKKYCHGHLDPDSGAPEIFAEQATNVCIGLPVQAKLDNIFRVWLNDPLRDPITGNPLPPPTDLYQHRDVIASRSIGATARGRGQIIYDYNAAGAAQYSYSSILKTLMDNCARR